MSDPALCKRSHVRATHAPDLDCGPYGCNICNLFLCEVCGCFEGSLASECPGENVSMEVQDAIYAGCVDFKDGQWKAIRQLI